MDYVCHVLIMVALYSILSTSLNLVIGLAGLFALSHAAFYAVGAYTTAILTTKLGIGFPWPLIIGAIFAAFVGMIIALPALRVGGHYLVIVTLALQFIVVDVLRNVNALTGGPDGINGISRITILGLNLSTPALFLPAAVIGAILCYFAARRIEASPLGRAMRAMRDTESAAEAAGKNVVAIKLTAFAASASLAAVAGALMAHYITFVGPPSFTIEETIYVLAMVILGGTGNLFGSVLGAVVLVTLPELLKFLHFPPATADMLRNVIYGTLLILILRFRPQGIVPERHNVKEKSLKAKHAAALGFIDGRQGSGMIMLAGKHLRKDFGGIRAVDDVSIDLRAGHVTGLIGPNGAGKTTAFNLLTGFILPTDGEIYLGGHPITGLKPHAIVRAGTARSFQDLRLFSKMTVLENVLVALPRQSGDNLWHVFFSPRRVAREERENVGKALGILQFVGLAQRKLDRAEDLSFAESKLLVIARVLATEADVLLLDEPLSGLDPPTLAAILPTMRRLAEMGKAVCIVEHNLDVIRSVCDSAYYLDEGRIMAVGAPAELMADANLQERYFQ